MDRLWRLIIEEDRDAVENMAVDESIFRYCTSGESPPTFRIYGWTKPSISIGHFQKIRRDEIDAGYCSEAGIELVRRPTGGRAVLHGHDITFSIALREDDLPVGFRSVKKSHIWLMQNVIAGMDILGLNADLGPLKHSVENAQRADCFAHVAQCDIRVGMEKIVGAAQVRKSGGILEQGSIPHTEPAVDPMRVFPNTFNAISLPLKDIPRDKIINAIILGCETNGGITFKAGNLSDKEKELSLKLASPASSYISGKCLCPPTAG